MPHADQITPCHVPALRTPLDAAERELAAAMRPLPQPVLEHEEDQVMQQTPILFLGDSPDIRSGLGRIGRDLAVHAVTLPQLRVGYLGRGGTGSRQLPFAQYNFPESDQWGEGHIERVWEDFAGDTPGVIFTIWDPTRLLWFAQPNSGIPAGLRQFLTSRRFKRWGYFPVDAAGPGGRLTTIATATLHGYDRVLGYTQWGANILSRSLGREVSWIPHGVNFNAFRPRDRKAARMALGYADRDIVVGCVATNQPRKDWGCAFGAMSVLHEQYPRMRFWAHTDCDMAPERGAWNMNTLIADFGAQEWARISLAGGMDDVEMSYCYSACDLVILPTLGEGFGYPVVEAMACGVPVVTGSYGGQAELVPDRSWLVEPVRHDGVMAARLCGPHNQLRPVYDPQAFAETCARVIENRPGAEMCREAVEHLDWTMLWKSCWSKWFLGGLK